MTKRKKTLYEEIGKFLRSQISGIFKRKWAYPITLVVVMILPIYAISKKMGVTVTWEGWKPNISIESGSNVNVMGPVIEQEMVSKHRYELEIGKREQIQKAFREFKEKAVEVSRLPKELQGTPDEVVAKITEMWKEMEKQCNSIWYSCYMISTELSRSVLVDTNIHVSDEDRKEVYRCVQHCLNVIGYYNGEIDGDQGRTNSAVINFQTDHSLKSEGKHGERYRT